MNDKKNQHYLPQSYLRGFEATDLHEKNRVWVFRAPNKMGDEDRRFVSSSWQHRPISRTASEPYRHSLKHADGTYDHTAEDWLGKLESQTTPILQKIQNGENLANEDFLWFARFVVLMCLRVPSGFAGINKTLNEIAAVDHGLRRQHWRRADNPTGQAAYDYYYPDGLPTRPNIMDTFDLLEFFLKTEVRALLSMRWIFRRASGNARFITSDNPVVIDFSSQDDTHRMSICFADGIHVPLSAHIDFMAIWDDRQSDFDRIMWAAADEKDVRTLNRCVAAGASKLLISSTPIFPGSDMPLNSFYSGVPNLT